MIQVSLPMVAAGRMLMVATQLLTAEELFLLPESEQGELVRGALQPMSPTGYIHSRLTHRLVLALGNWAAAEHAGVVGGELGFILMRNPDTVLAPDIHFIQADQAPAEGTPGYLSLAPDLAVEVLSPSNSASDMQEKIRIYLDAGVRLIWIVDPARNTVAEYAHGGATRWLTAADTLDGGDVLPGFSLDLGALFA
jgi:Uma2 family endonuclease